MPIQPDMGLPQPNNITNEGINWWMDQVRRAFEAGHHDALVGSCESIASNAQMLCMGTLDVM